MKSARLVRLQAASGLIFSVFLLLHLVNTASAVLGAGCYDAFQRVARLVYRQMPFELLGVGAALLIHVGVSLVLMKRRVAARPPLWLRLHRYSAYVLLAFVLTHALATRGVGLLLEVPIAAEYLTFTLRGWPAFFYPYYAVFFAAGAYHTLSGLRLALTRLRLFERSSPRPWRLYASSAVLIGLGGLGLLGLGGRLYSAPIPHRADYERLSAKLLPRFLARP